MSAEMKIYIHTDIEGVAGVVQWSDAHGYGGPNDPCGPYYERSKRLLTQEINAAIEGALEAGADEIVVSDDHGPGGIDPELLHPRAKLLFGKPFPKGRGFDASFDAMFFIGQHAMNLTPNANLCHTYSSVSIRRMLLNGQEIGEIGMRAALAGYFGVPVALFTGDDKACGEAKAIMPNVETVAVKTSMGRTSALCLHPIEARKAIKQGVARAMRRLGDFEPYLPPGPYEFIVEPYDLARCNSDDRSFDRPVGEPKVYHSDSFLEISR
jgi:D-amino peptidase